MAVTSKRRWSFGLRTLLLVTLLCGPLALACKWLTTPPPETREAALARRMKERRERLVRLGLIDDYDGPRAWVSFEDIENASNEATPCADQPVASH